jgi:hypothetical protein
MQGLAAGAGGLEVEHALGRQWLFPEEGLEDDRQSRVEQVPPGDVVEPVGMHDPRIRLQDGLNPALAAVAVVGRAKEGISDSKPRPGPRGETCMKDASAISSHESSSGQLGLEEHGGRTRTGVTV